MYELLSSVNMNAITLANMNTIRKHVFGIYCRLFNITRMHQSMFLQCISFFPPSVCEICVVIRSNTVRRRWNSERIKCSRCYQFCAKHQVCMCYCMWVRVHMHVRACTQCMCLRVHMCVLGDTGERALGRQGGR